MIEGNKVSYWETRTINIGDYENVQFGLSVAYSITSSDVGDSKVKITTSEAKEVSLNDMQEINKTAKMLQKVVQTRLDENEKKVRLQISGWAGVSYDPEAKLMKRGIIEKSEYSGSHNKRMELDDEDLK